MPPDERPPPADPLSAAEWLEVLRTGEVEVEGRMPWSSNATLLCTLRSSFGDVRAIYKPGRGERPLRDFPGGLFLREVAAYELSASCGLGVVPETVRRSDGPFGDGSFQRFIEADFSEHYFSLLKDDRHVPLLRRVAGFDLIANNADRKAGHLLLDRDRGIWGIDNGLCFHRQSKLRTVIWDFAGEELPAEILRACRSIRDELPPALLALLDPWELAALTHRAKRVLAEGCFPSPSEDGRAYPWPLV